MPKNVFASFDHDDADQVNGFRGLVANPNHPLQLHDRSLKQPVTDPNGRVIKVPPSDPRSKPVRDAIERIFETCSRLVVLIGPDTCTSAWVDWEIRTFYDMKEATSGEDTWRRIRGMRLKEHDDARLPKALLDGRSTKALDWDPDALDRWLEMDLPG